MSLNKIQLESPYSEVESLLNIDSLSKVHNELNITKPTIFYFMSDDEVLEVNRESLSHDYYTDVITFDYESDEDIEENEVVISWDRIQDNSKVLNQTLHQELHRICIHALLHLAGHTDESADEKLKMTTEEDRFLNLYCST
jgi:probable rRNA maturation factor